MPQCNALKNHLCISVDGNFLPCCRYSKHDQKFSIYDYTFDEYRKSDWFQNIISNMETGWDDGCLECKQEETILNRSSMRQNMNRSFTSDKIEFVELSVSNQCNITCRMCNSTYSSKWAEVDKIEIPKQDFNAVIKTIDWTHVKFVKYLGGEPFVTKEFKTLVDMLSNLKEIGLQVNTNCTLFPTKYIDKLKKFSHLQIALSIDGIGKVDEYVRQGTNWDKKLEVIDKWLELQKEHKNCKVFIHTVVQAHNIHDMKNVKAFAESKNLLDSWSPCPIVGPEEFRLEALDKDYVDQIKDEDNTVFLNTISSYSEDLNKKFKSTTERLDKLFGTKWEDIVK
jgi:sulfatase maturation enzyme AslB (radical SAM superfamily)